MADTIANVVVAPATPTDLYAVTGIAPGTKINVAVLGQGIAKLYSGATLAGEPTNTTGYREVYDRYIEFTNDTGDAGAWIWSLNGCTINVKVVA